MTITQSIEWDILARPIPGETESGDQYLVLPFPEGVLIAVIDGLGHGHKASFAALAAVEAMRQYAHEAVEELFRRVHQALRSTRGAVMTLASINHTTHTLTWAGVGNVNAVFVRDNLSFQTLMLRGGVVGYRLPRITSFSIPLQPKDTLIFATDGLRSPVL